MSIRPWCLVALTFLSTATAFAAEPAPALAPASAPLTREDVPALAADVPVDAAAPEQVELTPEQIRAMIAEFESTLSYQQGEVKVADDKAVLKLPATFRFLGAADARKVLEGPWGNPPDESVLGMLVPADVSPLDPDRGWAVIVTYEDSGHVDDEDAASIDYSELLASMKQDQEDRNKQRQEQGFPAVNLKGWAEQPHYDAANHKLYWAMGANFGGDDGDTLNYAIRVLGREGVLELNAVAPVERLADIKAGMEQVVGFASFTAGNGYADYNEGTDKLATYGVGGLIAGGLIAGKTGLLKGLWLALIAGKKFVVIGVIALGVFLKRMFSRNKDA